jgi:antitoxin PrlF
MATALTSKGQVTIPKRIRDALGLSPGAAVEFTLNEQRQVVLQPAVGARQRKPVADRFEAARGKADIRWRTRDLMKLLRSDA